MTPNRVNRAHWRTKEDRQKSYIFMFFFGPGKMAWDGPKWDPRGLFPANPDLADILGGTDLDFEIFYFFEFLDPKFLDFQVSRSPTAQISRSPGPQTSKFPDSQIPRFPDFQTPPAPADELSDPNLTPLPTHPGIKYVARSPCCDLSQMSLGCPTLDRFETHECPYKGRKNN